MPNYIDKDKLIRDLIDNRNFYPVIVKNAIENAPTEDVVPRSEVEQLQRNLEQCENGYKQQIHIMECKHKDEVDKLRNSVDEALKLFGTESKKVEKLQKQLAPFREIGCETCKHYGTGFDHMPCYRCRDYNEYVWLSADEPIEKQNKGGENNA